MLCGHDPLMKISLCYFWLPSAPGVNLQHLQGRHIHSVGKGGTQHGARECGGWVCVWGPAPGGGQVQRGKVSSAACCQSTEYRTVRLQYKGTVTHRCSTFSTKSVLATASRSIFRGDCQDTNVEHTVMTLSCMAQTEILESTV
jgi:hypothetical protein